MDVRTRQEIVLAELPIWPANKHYQWATWPVPSPPHVWDFPLEIDKMFNRYAPKLYAQYPVHDDLNPQSRDSLRWDQLLANCLFDIDVYGSDSQFSVTDDSVDENFPRKQFKGLKFKTYQDFENFVISNLFHHTDIGKSYAVDYYLRAVNAKIYSVIDEAIPSIDRILGYNKFFVGLNGSATWSTDIQSIGTAPTAGASSKFPFMKEFIQQAWQQIWGITVDDIMYTSDFLQWQKAMWLPIRKNKNLYRLPATNTGKGLDGEPAAIPGTRLSRMVWNTATSAFENPITTDLYQFDIVKTCLMPLVDKPTVPSGWDGYIWGPTPVVPGDANIGGVSQIAVYGVSNGDRKAIYIKPFAGQDVFCIPKFDTNLYQLEGVFTAPMKRPEFRVFDVTPWITGGGTDFMSIRIPVTELMLGGNTKKVNPWLAGDLRLFIRKKGTEFVSPISHPYLKSEYATRSRMAAMNYLVAYDF